MLLEVNNIKKSFVDRKIIDDISFKMYKRDKVGLIGQNGIGKSTILKLITGELEKDEGQVRFYGKWGYLPQKFDFNTGLSVYQYIKDEVEYPKLMETVSKFGFKDKLNQQIITLSGGEKTKLYLMKVLLIEPEILILDEPTNHIDMETIKWIEDYLIEFNGALLIVTHDRYLLDKVVNKIIEVKGSKIKEYSGNFTFYENKKRLEEQREWIEYEKYLKKKKDLEKAARLHMDKAGKYNNISVNDFQRSKSKKAAKQSKAILSRLNKMEKKEKPKEQATINLQFDSIGQKTGNILIRGEGVKKIYDRVLFKDVDFTLSKGQKVALLGGNGIGKTTLLRAIVGKEIIEGTISISPSANIGYFSQELEGLNQRNILLDEIKMINNDETLIRTLLGCLLFKRDDVFKRICELSQGEKVKVAFAKLLLSDINIMILDEPTNYLDIESKQRLEDALIEFDGTILFVSHDRYFIKKLATEIWEIQEEGLVTYKGNYEYFVDKKERNNDEKKDDDRNNILILETKLSQISGQLDNCNEEDKEELNRQFLYIAKRLRELKDK